MPPKRTADPESAVSKGSRKKQPKVAAAAAATALVHQDNDNDHDEGVEYYAGAMGAPIESAKAHLFKLQSTYNELVALPTMHVLQRTRKGIHFEPISTDYDYVLYQCDLRQKICVGGLVLIPSLAHVNNVYRHFLLPAFTDKDTNDSAVLVPPYVAAAELVADSDIVDLNLFQTLAPLYTARITTEEENLLADIPSNREALTKRMWTSIFATGDAIDWQVAFFETLTGATDTKQGMLQGYAALGKELKLEPEHEFYASVLRRLAPPPTATKKTARLLELERQLAEERAENEKLRLELGQLRAENEKLRLAPQQDKQEAKREAKREIQADVLRDMRRDNKDLGLFINFTLKHMYMDLETDEFDNWTNRKDALAQLQEDVLSKLEILCQKQVHDQEILATSDPEPGYDVFKARMAKDMARTMEGWDHATLLAKFQDLSIKHASVMAELTMYQHMYHRVLRVKEEQFALALKRERKVLVSAGVVQTMDKAWNGLVDATRMMTAVLDSEPTAYNDQGDWSMLLAAGALRKLLEEAYVAATAPGSTPASVCNAILLGSGKSRLNVSVLHLQDMANFESPMESFLVTLASLTFDERTYTVASSRKRVSFLHQALLAVAGRPFAQQLVLVADEARWHFRHVLGFTAAANKAIFDSDKVLIPNEGEPDFAASIEELTRPSIKEFEELA